MHRPPIRKIDTGLTNHPSKLTGGDYHINIRVAVYAELLTGGLKFL